MQKINIQKKYALIFFLFFTSRRENFSLFIYFIFYIRPRVKSLFNLFISSVMQQLPYENSVFIYKERETLQSTFALTAALV